jgi:vitamin K-dependent gamma-carboxylase
LQFHVGITYLYGGIAKLTPDWMLGQPMGIYLATKSSWPVVGSWFAYENAGVLFSYGGLLFDLLIVPFLIWKKTRVLAFLGCVLFHLSNALLFQIHIFPWFMIAATTLFFDPDWVRQLLTSGKAQPIAESIEQDNVSSLSFRDKAFAGLLIAYVAFQLVWPLRSRLYSEETSWTERGHLFSWRMMLRAKEVGLGYAIRNPKTGEVSNANHAKYLDEEQAEKFGRDPMNIVALAKFLAVQWEKENGVRPQVYAFVAASLNGRKPQLMIDPNLDLASLSDSDVISRSFVMPLEEPLRSPPWNIPVSQWKEHIAIPELKFMKPKNE